MRVLVIGALALVLAGCGAIEADRDQTLKENIQQAREAYETCLTIHNNVDPDSCASYKAAWENDKAVWRRLHPDGQMDQTAPGSK
jgi:hypothetical protein